MANAAHSAPGTGSMRSGVCARSGPAAPNGTGNPPLSIPAFVRTWRLRCCALLGFACVQSALADTTLHDFGAASFSLSAGLAPVRYGWSSGDSLIAEFGASGSIGHISGGENVVVIPEIKFLGNTIVPEVRRDTRSGLRLSSSVEGYAGVVLDAGMTLGGEGISATIEAGPRLTLPTEG